MNRAEATEGWQMSWYVKTVEDGINEYGTAKEAEQAARGELQYHEDRAGEGWHESVTDIEWGEMISHAYTVQTSEEPAPEGSQFDTIATYELRSQALVRSERDEWERELVRLAQEYREAQAANDSNVLGCRDTYEAMRAARSALLDHAYNGGKAP